MSFSVEESIALNEALNWLFSRPSAKSTGEPVTRDGASQAFELLTRRAYSRLSAGWTPAAVRQAFATGLDHRGPKPKKGGRS